MDRLGVADAFSGAEGFVSIANSNSLLFDESFSKFSSRSGTYSESRSSIDVS